MEIGVVIVTYNRIEKLKQAIESYENQTYLPSYIIVVNNCSTDGTKKFLDNWSCCVSKIQKYVYHIEENMGGSAGFAYGMRKALNLNADWIWIGDDDAYPNKNALEIANEVIERKDRSVVAISACVMTAGKIVYEHRRHLQKGVLKVKSSNSTYQEYQQDEFEIDELSYVGAVISKEAIKKAGVTKEDYFIWYDDTEHSMRLRNCGKIICVPRMQITHDVVVDNDNEDALSWKWYYGVRNQIDAYRCNMTVLQYSWIVVKYYYYLIKISFSAKERRRAKMLKAALRDGRNGKMGKHPQYCPGWK